MPTRKMTLGTILTLSIEVAAILGAGVAFAQSDDELRSAFDDVMLNPSATAPNLRYATLARSRGELRKALGAYERILAAEPGNAEALAGQRRILRELEPDSTRFIIGVGGLYQSNPRHASVANRSTDDFNYGPRFRISDERRVFNIRWRTQGDAFINKQGEFRDIDVGSVGFRSGPVVHAWPGVRLHPFIGLSYQWLDQRTFYGEPTAGITLETDNTGPLREITARWGYQRLGRHLTSRDGMFVEIFPRFVFADIGLKESTTTLIPYWRYNGVVGSGVAVEPFGLPFPSRFHQLGVRGEYMLRLFRHFGVGASMGYEYRHYFEQFTAERNHRRDHVIIPGGQMVLFGMAGDRFDIAASYNFEHRASNDGVARYNNHAVGLRAQWRF